MLDLVVQRRGGWSRYAMIPPAVLEAAPREGGWPVQGVESDPPTLFVDWDTWAATAAATAALAQTPFADWSTTPAVIEVTVRLTTDAEVRSLNRQYRGKDRATNVLSFPMVPPDLLATLAEDSESEILLGDIVLAHGVCTREAKKRGIGITDHATHLLIHGLLHLLGYDHQDDATAEAMEALERAALARLGLHDPYPIDED